ncbi:MAG TPA: DUF962 domain-containing protein [Vicinamibacteria bacterium]|nr:DUF962 domain-containing protein [Vicinamibacteria bacterium]
MPPRFERYEDFWPYYVSEHSRPGTRALHFVGTALVLASAVLALGVSPFWLAGAPVFGYGFAWAGHFFVERNRPATFTYPLWSLRGDFRMFRLTLLGKMGPELERAGRLFPRAA